MLIAWIVAGLSLLIWIGLVLWRGGFWIVRPTLLPSSVDSGDEAGCRGQGPAVVAIIPARNEETLLRQTLPTVLNQHYAGEFHAILVDDRSDDATSAVAKSVAEHSNHGQRFSLFPGKEIPAGWAGKVWAMHQGSRLPVAKEADYLWFTDADVAHDQGTLRALVTKAVRSDLDMVSLMALLRVDSILDRLLIPAFVYFFAKLYPFRVVSNPSRRLAGAAGGCILVRREALDESGGVEAIHNALIDDCALAKLLKRGGNRIWLGFALGTRSVRPYGTLKSVWNMVARSAFHQLDYSVPKLAGTVLGMLLIYAAPPILTMLGFVLSVLGAPTAYGMLAVSAAGWGLMSISFLPMLRHQRCSSWLAPLLPIAGVLYTAMTVSSAWCHFRGRGGMWKGRQFSTH